MMQNSLRLLLDGIVESLTERVAPTVEDEYARAQVLAAADIIGALAPRVAWDRSQTLGWVPEAHALARRAREAPGVGTPPAELVEALAAELAPDAGAYAVEHHLRLQRAGLVALQRYVGPAGAGEDAALAGEVAALVARWLDAELALLPAPPLDPRRAGT
jgi:hypothetical protein